MRIKEMITNQIESYQLSWKRKLATVKGKKADVSSSDEGLTLEKSAFFTLYHGQFTFST